VELLLALPRSRKVIDRLDLLGWHIAAPQLLTIEMLQVLRRRVAAGTTSVDAAEQALDALEDSNIHFFDHALLARRIWQLRGNLTAYDASFVALAEALNCELITADARLANAPGHTADVFVIA